MSQNPYQAPMAKPTSPVKQSGRHDLATRGNRLIGALIDGLVMSLVIFPAIFFVLFPMFGENFQTSGRLMFNPLYSISGFVLGQAVFLLVQGYLLATRGQTVGKLLVKTQIVSDRTGQVPPFMTIYGLRYLLMAVLFSIPFGLGNILAIVNVCLIFRSSHKCLHDEIAGTIVVNYHGS